MIVILYFMSFLYKLVSLHIISCLARLPLLHYLQVRVILSSFARILLHRKWDGVQDLILLLCVWGYRSSRGLCKDLYLQGLQRKELLLAYVLRMILWSWPQGAILLSKLFQQRCPVFWKFIDDLALSNSFLMVEGLTSLHLVKRVLI